MLDFKKLISLLSETAEENFLPSVVKLMEQQNNWFEHIINYFPSIDEDEYCIQYKELLNPSPSPEFIPIYYDKNNQFKIMLTYFRNTIHLKGVADKTVTPHFHHFPFVIKVLHGGYKHWVYKTGGVISDTPVFTEIIKTECKAGDVYGLPHNLAHFVWPPIDETISIMIRGPQKFEKIYPEQKISKAEIIKRKNNLFEAIKNVGKWHAEYHSEKTASIVYSI